MVVRREGDSDRFEMRGELGVGATGAVYRVFDRQRGEEVALKTLRRVSGSDLYRFKREFRSLIGVEHPNLASLHELFVVGDEWMFTMELVDGVRFDHWVRRERPAAAIEDAEDATVQVPRRVAGTGALDEPRLRAALVQLADGLCALHDAGKVHRDLKPSNVLVTPDGRLVILDFGLVVEPDVVDRTHEGGSVGTVAYMSPEQSADLPLTPASDWYAVGVMLYEALTGQRPIRGAAHDVLVRKQLEDPPPPRAIATGVPVDLDALCMKLLDREPQARPDGYAVLAALDATPSAVTCALLAQRTGPDAGDADPAALAELRQAYTDSRDHFVLVVVIDPNGTKKTALLEVFLEEVARMQNAIVLTGNDSEREQTRLPGLDQALDQLSAHVMSLPRSLAEQIVQDAAPLARLFPALRRIPALQFPTLPKARPSTPAEIFHDGMVTLRRVLHRIAETRPLVIAVDDARGPIGADAQPMSANFAGPDMPRMLAIAAMAPDAVEGSDAIADFCVWRDEQGGDLRFIHLDG